MQTTTESKPQSPTSTTSDLEVEELGAVQLSWVVKVSCELVEKVLPESTVVGKPLLMLEDELNYKPLSSLTRECSSCLATGLLESPVIIRQVLYLRVMLV